MPKKMVSETVTNLPVPAERIERRIYFVRGQKVMLDTHLASLYQVPTFRLNEAVKRNHKRFPEDFTFQLTSKEARFLTSQNAMSNSGRGGRRTLPYAFTEHGVAMLSSVLTSDRAVEVNIAIVRAFVKLREVMATHKDLALKIAALERRYNDHDNEIQTIFKAIKKLLEPPAAPRKRPIGFNAGNLRSSPSILFLKRGTDPHRRRWVGWVRGGVAGCARGFARHSLRNAARAPDARAQDRPAGRVGVQQLA
jgi:hypothetical protein